MKKLDFFLTFIVVSIIIFNVQTVLYDKEAFNAPSFSFQKALADGEESGQKWNFRVEYETCSCVQCVAGWALFCTCTMITEYCDSNGDYDCEPSFNYLNDPTNCYDGQTSC